MIVSNITYQIWADLYEAAIAFRDAKPWEWMYDSNLFGVQDPISGQIGYCIIMGAAKEVFALGVYPGLAGYESYLNLLNKHDSPSKMDQISVGVNQNILKIEMVNREEIDKKDREIYKALDLKFRGKHQWIIGREWLPGYYPGHLTDDQALFMTHALQQSLQVALRFKNKNLILENEKDQLLVRVSTAGAKGLEWQDKYLDEPVILEPTLRQVDQSLIKKAKRELSKQPSAICFSINIIPGAMSAQGVETRPFFAQIALWIQYKTGAIIDHKIFTPKQMGMEFDLAFIDQFYELGFLPQQIIIDSQYAGETIITLAEALDIEVILAPGVDDFEVVDAMMANMMMV